MSKEKILNLIARQHSFKDWEEYRNNANVQCISEAVETAIEETEKAERLRAKKEIDGALKIADSRDRSEEVLKKLLVSLGWK